MRSLRAFVALGVVVAAAVASAASSSPPAPPLQHPDPFLTNLSLDYVNPIAAPGGGAATLQPVGAPAAQAAEADLAYLRYRTVGDWGGFLPAPVGRLALGEPGGSVRSFTFRHANHSGGRPSQGHGGQGHGGAPIVPPPPLPGPRPGPKPGPNGCFSGCHKPAKHHTHHKHRRKKRGGAGNCGTAGLSITSNLKHCRINVLDRRPGQGTFERLTIRNTSSSGYVLSFRATGRHNPLWNDLQLGIWKHGKPAPTPLPPLRFWTTQFTKLATLAPGKSVRLTIEMYLPPSAGNGDQSLRAVVSFLWRAAAKR